MGDREKILKSIQKSKSSQGESRDQSLIEINEFCKYSDPLEKAKEMVVAVGGELLIKDSEEYVAWKPENESLTIQGEFLVAENGAIWVVPPEGADRSSIFLAEHLIIEVPKAEVLNNMHEAYARIRDYQFSYGTFISGPSKTADIEQSLVIGAQGPKSCMVVLT